MVTAAELTELANQTSELQGWDFSQLNIEESPDWVFEDIVRPFLRPGGRVLDLGTGGGEVFASLAASFEGGLGIDVSEKRLLAATSRGTAGLSFAIMSNTELGLASACFDVVLAKHADYSPAEVVRVLRPGGHFLTQQMGDRDTSSIFEAFQWGSFGAYWRRRFASENRVFRPTRDSGDDFERLGCDVLDYRQYDVPMYFRDLRSLVLFLKASPLPDAFDPETQWMAVSRLLEEHSTARGIETNTHRELLVVRKPESHLP